MFRGFVLFAVVCVAVTAQSQSLEERLRAYGFVLDVADLEQHKILAKDDSSPFYMRLDEKWHDGISDGLDGYSFKVTDRASADEWLKEIEELLPDVWALTTRPRYYLAADWSNPPGMMVPHQALMRRAARVHSSLIMTASEDGQYDDVGKSLVAMRTLADHARDLPSVGGTLAAQGIESIMQEAIVKAGTQFSGDADGIRLLREFVDSIVERPKMEGFKNEVPSLLATIEQLVAGELTMRQIYAASVGADIEGGGGDQLFPYSEYRGLLRDRVFSMALNFADVWGDQAAVDKVQDELEASLEVDSEDPAVLLPNMVMSALLLQFSSINGFEQSAQVSKRITKIGLAAMDFHLQNGEWPTLEAAAKLANIQPIDPFGGRIGYMPSEDSLLMYSIGWDQIDDGGLRRADSDGTYDYPVVVFNLKK